MVWGALFERAAAFGIDEADVREALAARRGAEDGGSDAGEPGADA